MKDELLELYESMSDEELSQLSDEELTEIESILSSEPMQENQPNFAPSVKEMEQAKADVEPTTSEAVSAGWVEGIPFMKDAVAMADAVDEDNLSYDEAYSRYKSNMDEINDDLNNAERQKPGAFFAGDIAGTAATMAAGGALLKGAGAGKVLTETGMSMATGVGTGALSQTSRSEDRTLVDPLIGGAMGYAGEKSVQLMKRGGKYLMDKADDMNVNAVKRIMGMDKMQTKRHLYNHLKRTNQKESEFMNDVLTQKMPDGDELVVSFKDAPERMLDKIQVKKNEVGENLSSIYSQVDESFDVKIDPKGLKKRIENEVAKPFLDSDDPATREIGESLLSFTKDIGRKIKSVKEEFIINDIKPSRGLKPNTIIEYVDDPSPWNVQKVHQLQKDIRRRVESIYKSNSTDITVAKRQQAKVASSLGDIMDDILREIPSESGDKRVLDTVMKLRKQYGNLSQVEESVENVIRRGEPSSWESAVKDFFSFRNAVATTVTSSIMGPTAGVPAGFALKKVIDNPKTPVYVARGIGKLGSIISANPTGRIASRLNTAALLSDSEFKRAIYGTIAEVNLKQNPLPRNTDDAKARIADIRHYIKFNAPSMIQDFDAILEQDSDEALAMFLDNVSKMEGTNKMFEGGVGFNGKVYNEEDKAQLESQIKETDMPAAQRMELLTQLRKRGIIPDFDQIVIPEPVTHIPKNRKIQDY